MGGSIVDTLETVLVILLVVDAIALGALVLIQQGKGADVGAAFGSGSANTVFGSAGSASFLTKVTVWLSIGFFVISFGLAYSAKERAGALRDIDLPGFGDAPILDEGDEPTFDGDLPFDGDEPAADEDLDSDLPDV